MSDKVSRFFSLYDEANNTSNLATFAKLYADRFLFAGPNGVHQVERDSFVMLIPSMKARLTAMGLKERHVQSVDSCQLDSKYLLAKVGWKMGIESLSEKRHIEAFATFLLMRDQEDALSIIAQIDHQDLAGLLKLAQSP